MVYVKGVDSEAGSLTVAMQLPLASGSVVCIAEVPPADWLPLGQLASSVKYVDPDHSTEMVVGPIPVKAKPLERCPGGLRIPSVRSLADDVPDVGAVVVVVVVGGAAGAVVVVTLAGAVVGVPTPLKARDDSNDVPDAEVSEALGGMVVVVATCAARAPPVDPVDPVDLRDPAACPVSLAAALANPCGCFVARGDVPAVATSSAMSANDTARITHQLGRPRAARDADPLWFRTVPRPRAHHTHASSEPHWGNQAHRCCRPRLRSA